MAQADGLVDVGVQIARQLKPVIDQRISVQIIFPLLLATAQELHRRVVLIVTGIAVYRERNEVGTGSVQLLRELVLRLKQRETPTGLNAWIVPRLAYATRGNLCRGSFAR